MRTARPLARPWSCAKLYRYAPPALLSSFPCGSLWISGSPVLGTGFRWRAGSGTTNPLTGKQAVDVDGERDTVADIRLYIEPPEDAGTEG